MIADIESLLAQGVSIGMVYSLLVSKYPDVVDAYCRHVYLRTEEIKHDLEPIH